MQRHVGNVVLHAGFIRQRDGTAAQVVEAAEQVDDGGLARARRADKRNAFARLDVQVDILEDGLPFLIAEGDVVVINCAGNGRKCLGIRLVVNHDWFIHRLEDALQIRHVVHEAVVDVRQIRNRLPETADVLPHGENYAEGDYRAAQPVHTRVVHEGENNLGDDFRREPDAVGDVNRLQPRRAARRRQALHDGAVDILPREQFAHAHAVNGFRQIRVVVAVFVRLILPRAALTRLQDDDNRHENRQPRHNNRRQRRLGRVHVDDDEDDVDDFQNRVDDAVGKNIRHTVDVIDDAHEDFARRTAVVVGKGQLLQVREEVFADVVDDLLTDERHDARADDREDDADDDDAHERQRHLQQQVNVFLRHSDVHDGLGDFRHGEARYRCQGGQKQRQQHLPFVLADVNANALQVPEVKRGFQALVYVKFVARHVTSPPAERCRA